LTRVNAGEGAGRSNVAMEPVLPAANSPHFEIAAVGHHLDDLTPEPDIGARPLGPGLGLTVALALLAAAIALLVLT